MNYTRGMQPGIAHRRPRGPSHNKRQPPTRSCPRHYSFHLLGRQELTQPPCSLIWWRGVDYVGLRPPPFGSSLRDALSATSGGSESNRWFEPTLPSHLLGRRDLTQPPCSLIWWRGVDYVGLRPPPFGSSLRDALSATSGGSESNRWFEPTLPSHLLGRQELTQPPCSLIWWRGVDYVGLRPPPFGSSLRDALSATSGGSESNRWFEPTLPSHQLGRQELTQPPCSLIWWRGVDSNHRSSRVRFTV